MVLGTHREDKQCEGRTGQLVRQYDVVWRCTTIVKTSDIQEVITKIYWGFKNYLTIASDTGMAARS